MMTEYTAKLYTLNPTLITRPVQVDDFGIYHTYTPSANAKWSTKPPAEIFADVAAILKKTQLRDAEWSGFADVHVPYATYCALNMSRPRLRIRQLINQCSKRYSLLRKLINHRAKRHQCRPLKFTTRIAK